MKNWLFKPTLQSITIRITIPTLISIILFVCAIYIFLLPMFEKHLMERKKDMVCEMVNSAWSLLATYNEQVLAGELTLAVAQQRALERLRHMRYGKDRKDYFWINDQHPVMIMHPYQPELEGCDLSAYTDPRGTRLFVEAVKAVQSKGGGHITYMWQWKDNPQKIVPKISYVKGFAPWQWIVGSGIYVEDVHAEINSLMRQISIVALAILGVLFVLSGYIISQSIAAERHRKKTAQALQRSAAQYRELVESANSIILRWKPSGEITYCNDFALRFFGYHREELLGQSISGTIVPEIESSGRDLSARMHELAEHPDRFETNENENICKDGRRVWISWANKALCNADNTVLEILSIGNDATERKQAEKERSRLS
ncbi:MAG: PAS domain S-box protein, partial [Deltaproteobacteria bacterium]|nr:PAS domain S-box protein [Deltaproteobacteria bacterium]